MPRPHLINRVLCRWGFLLNFYSLTRCLVTIFFRGVFLFGRIIILVEKLSLILTLTPVTNRCVLPDTL